MAVRPATAGASAFAVIPTTSSGVQGNRQVTLVHVSPNGRVISTESSAANTVNFGSGIGVPGLGFDYTHLAAVSAGWANNRSNFARGVHHAHNFVTPIFFGGFPYYSDYPDPSVYQLAQQQPQVIVIQQPAPIDPVQQTASPTQDFANADSTVPAAPPAPVRDVGEFVLIRRDGKILFASAFSVSGTQLQYVTPEGIRHTLPFAELDAVATQDMNEARGTSVQFHN